MALPLGKVAFLFGTGVVVSALAKESSFSDYLSGAFKIFFKQIKEDSSKNSNHKPRNDALLLQVNSLQEQLQLLASNRSVTVVTSYGSGSSGKYGLILVVVVVGYGYIWWKGWKLSDFMFATRRGLADACTSVSKQLESVNESVSATRHHISSRIDRIDCKVDECTEDTAAIQEEVSEILGKVKTVDSNLQSVQLVFQTLETKISRIEWMQNDTIFGVRDLVTYAKKLENERDKEQIEASSPSLTRPALELPEACPLLPNANIEPPSPSVSNGLQKESLLAVLSSSGVKIHRGLLDLEAMKTGSSGTPSRATSAPPTPLCFNTRNSTSALFGRTLSASAADFLTSRRSCQTLK
ncbi:unnamed protein product [Cuscuta epithymum]|uniref:DUF1664 domain-containing protein n=1 Tax=Cuscuta epithymum TaxID=186058 RepID=A0AAV0BZY1_9ASTE|nr:unnamed protein product [Cuscuta epithymum]CAH9143369.1 unnamed protein product [Cuscuta epithymum]